MKITFKSTQFDKNKKEQGVIEFTSRLEREEDEGFECLIFQENRNGKIITNRIEYNQNTLRIYSGVSSLTCKLNEVIKNDFALNGTQIGNVFLYTKMIENNIEDKNNLSFKYLIAATSDCKEATTIELEFKIHD